MRILIPTLLLCLLASSVTAIGGEIDFQPCQVKKAAVSVDGECATLNRPENPEDPGGKQVRLSVVKFRARTPEPAADAFTVIQGGPGMSSIDLYLSMRDVFGLIQAKRDILVIDQRGTGRSDMLVCDFDDEDNYTVFDPTQTREAALNCLAQLEADPRFYTTSVAVQDLDAVRAAAGYDQLSIYGVSYGTRVAQHYLRQFPERTRAVVLDGVADVELNLAGSEIARRSQEAFDRMAKRCSENSDCQKQFGDLKTTFEALRTSLREQAETIQLAHPVTGKIVEQVVSEQHLLGLVRLMPYSTESLALLPFILDSAQRGNYVPLAAQAILAEEQFGQDYSIAMNNSVICAEDMPFLTDDDLQGQDDTFFGNTMSESMKTVCEVWPLGPVDEGFKEPFSSHVPALLLSGETDPITPPENAERAASMFADVLHVEVPGHGHGVIGRGCLPQLVSDFIESGTTADLDAACAERERALPFFMTPAGPTP